MVRLRSLLAVALALAPVCRADTAPSASFVERPLVLPPSTIRPQAAWEMLAVRGIDRSPPATGHWPQMGIDVGVAPGLQLGIAGSEEVSPRAAFDRIALRGVVGLHEDAALRFDAGNYRSEISGNTDGSWALGLGVPIRIAVSGKLAVFTGRIVALPPIGGTLSLAFADDFLTVDLNHSNVTATIGIPLQVLVEPLPGLALALRSGYRHGWGGGNFSADWIPLGADLLVNVASRVDLIATAEVPGETGTYGSFESLTALFFVRTTVAVTF